MGSSASRLLSCVRPSASAAAAPPPLDETLGHSFCYLRSSSLDAPTSDTAFLSISGASVSANSSTSIPIHSTDSFLPTTHFNSSSSFSALPLQLATSTNATATTAPLDRGFFLSGPIERGALSGPLDPVQFSGPLVSDKQKPKSLSKRFQRRRPASFSLKRCASEKNHRPWVVPIPNSAGTGTGMEGVQWAQGKAGEDRVHVVISEEHRWLFVGIYDGFNGPDAPDFLVSHLYQSLHVYLRGLFWEEGEVEGEGKGRDEPKCEKIGRQLWQFLEEDECGLEFSGMGRFAFSLSKIRYGEVVINFSNWS